MAPAPIARVVVVASLATVRAAGSGGGRGKGSGGGGARGKKSTRGGTRGGSDRSAGGGTATKKKASRGSDAAKKKQRDERDDRDEPQPQQQTAVRPPVNGTIPEESSMRSCSMIRPRERASSPWTPPRPPAATTVQDRLFFERKGHVCVRNVLTRDEARSMAVALVRETRQRTLLAYKHRVSVLCPPGAVDVDAIQSEEEAMKAIARYSDEEVGFLQTFNIHRDNYVAGESSNDDSSRTAVSGDSTSDGIKECAGYIMSRRLARIAAELLGADENEGDRVRLYQSCVFVKPPGFGETNWHSDANMVPLDTNR